jgi:hypothetical protein
MRSAKSISFAGIGGKWVVKEQLHPTKLPQVTQVS